MKINSSYIFAGVLTLLIIGWFLLHNDDTQPAQTSTAQSRAEAQKDAPLPSVVIRRITAQDHVNRLSLYGRTEPAREVSIKAQTTGVIIETPAREGRIVQKGDVLCRQDIDARQAMLDQASANLRAVEVDLNAARILAEKGFQSATRVTAIEAQMDAAKAAIKQAEIELGNVITRAPYTGIWERQMAEVGDYLSPGEPCGLLVELNPLIIAGDLTETQINKIKVGQEANISLATGETVSGKVRLIEAKANPSTRTFRMEISTPNTNYSLKSGVTADISVISGTVKAQNIPSQILTIDDAGNTGIRYLNNDDTVAFAQVTAIDEDSSGLWVTGLPETTRIIVKGQDYVARGVKVAPTIEGEL